MTDPLTPEQIAAKEAQAAKEGYLHRDLVGLDQFANVVLDGPPDDTISSRAQRAADAGKLWGKAMTKFLHLFQTNHGQKAEAGDIERAKMEEQRDETDLGI